MKSWLPSVGAAGLILGLFLGLGLTPSLTAAQPPADPVPGQPHAAEQEQVYHQGRVEGEAASEEHGLRADDAEGVEADAHGEVHLSDVWASIEFWGSVVNFLLLIGIIVFLARKPMGSFLVGRRKLVEEGLAESSRLRAAAQQKYDEYTQRLKKLDREIAQIRKEMIAAGEAERDRIVAEAEAKAARMRREAEFLIDQQLKQLRVDLTREAVEAAVTAAEQVLVESTTPSDQQRLAQQYLDTLATEAKAAGEVKA